MDTNRNFLRLIKQAKPKASRSIFYFTYIAMVVDEENFPEINSLTLGQYLFALKLTLEDEYALGKYSDFLGEVHKSSN